MAKIVEGQPTKWSAVIRCCQGAYVNGQGNAVAGCFALIEIEAADLVWTVDYEGDGCLWCKCPACGKKLYPKWQLATVPNEVYERPVNR
jgi:hypothetical protein